MSDRVTKKLLDTKLGYINKRMGRPETAYTRRAGQSTISNDGHLFIDHDNGYTLKEMVGTAGGQGGFGTMHHFTGADMYAVLDVIEHMLFLQGK